MKTKCYSLDNEEFRYDDIGQVLDALDSDEGILEGRAYFEADCRPLGPMDFDYSIINMLEALDEELYEHVGEISDCDFTGVGPDAKAELINLVHGWIAKYVNTAQYSVILGKSRECRVTAQDVSDAASNAQAHRAPQARSAGGDPSAATS